VGTRRPSDISRTLRAREKYYKDPSYCEFCGTRIEIGENQTPSQAKRKYCSHSCAASATNRSSPKRRPEGKCHQCLIAINSTRMYCGAACKSKASYERRKVDPKSSVTAVIEWRRRLKRKAIEHKGGKCEECGYNKCADAMDFHHIDPTEKDFQIGGSTRSWEKVVTELDKCKLLCANCHRELHSVLRG